MADRQLKNAPLGGAEKLTGCQSKLFNNSRSPIITVVPHQDLFSKSGTGSINAHNENETFKNCTRVKEKEGEIHNTRIDKTNVNLLLYRYDHCVEVKLVFLYKQQFRAGNKRKRIDLTH